MAYKILIEAMKKGHRKSN